ncbi:hypothetical protein DF213_08665 [Dickeya dianthicola]|uniref:Uncharacterized protein n=1 Tax=Dickeya dianthicola TaxID=204039 RepID=A0AAX1C849_9GAMM|nr:hypothetical protein DF213_08665 [Dickeya dianthicola]
MFVVYTFHTSSCRCYSAHPWASPLRGRGKPRSTLLPAALSFTRITYLGKLIGIHSLAALQG